MEYNVSITDTYAKTFIYTVESENEDLAQDIAEDIHDKDNTLPTLDDFTGWEIDNVEQLNKLTK